MHANDETSLKGRCYVGSAEDHWANACPARSARRTEGKPDNSSSLGLKEGGKAKGKGKPVKGTPKVKAVGPSEGISVPEVSEGAISQVSGAAEPSQAQPPNVTTELAREMTEVLKSLRLKKLGLSQVLVQGEPTYGLIDSGATSALRQARDGELMKARVVQVQLAVGSTELWLLESGTLLSDRPVQPIIPMACLPALGCLVNWSDKGLSICHPTRGKLPVRLTGLCPELPADLTVQSIHEYEVDQEQRARERLCRVRSWDALPKVGVMEGVGHDFARLAQDLRREGCTVSAQLKLFKQLFPQLPREIAAHTPTLVHLFAGEQRWRDCPGFVLGVELKDGADLLSDDVFGMLVQAACAGCIDGCLAGPPCRTVSACRCSNDGGPRVVRSREGFERFGLASNTEREQSAVDTDTVLWFRTMLLFVIIAAYATSKPFLAWEHPEDPRLWSNDPRVQSCPSVWQFPEMQVLQRLLDGWLSHFDQGAFGHARRKPTALLCTSWQVHEALEGRGGQGSGEAASDRVAHTGYQSQAWAKWAPGFVDVLKEGWNHHVRTTEASRNVAESSRRAMLRTLSPQWQAHVEADHVPYRKDCEVCLQAASRGRAHYKQESSAFYALSSDISGPFAPGQDVSGKRKNFVVFTIRAPVGRDFPWQAGAKGASGSPIAPVHA